MRTLCAVLAGLVFTATAARAGDGGVANNWKVTIFAPGQALPLWLLKIEDKDGKLTGKLTKAEEFPPPSSLKELQLKDRRLTVVLDVNRQPIEFRFQVPRAGEKTLFGTVDLNGQVMPVQLTVTDEEKLSLKNMPAAGKLGYDSATDILKKTPDSGRVFEAIEVVVFEAAHQKVKEEELRGWIAAALGQAVRYGPEWRQEVSLKVAEGMAHHKEYSGLALEVIRGVNKDLGDKANALLRLRGLNALATALKTAGKAEEVAALAREMDALEIAAHKEYEKTALGFEVEKYKGRKKGNRVVLVELFTGAQCPPCVAADLAFDGLERAFTNKEVVLLQYHLHIPEAGRLTTPDSEARQDYYEIQGTPNIFFNGKSMAGGGGGKSVAQFKYNDYRGVVEPLLEGETTLKLTADAVRQGDQVKINATVEGVKKPGEKVKLRLALVEEWVRYRGSNGLPYHSRVVRALPGGTAGLALTKESGQQTAAVDLGELRKTLAKFLAPDGVTDPAPYRKLFVVAFVQDDATREVLHAIEVPVRRE